MEAEEKTKSINVGMTRENPLWTKWIVGAKQISTRFR